METKKYNIKVCGMRNPENIQDLIKLPIDFIGFIFYPKSKRYVGCSPEKEIFDLIPAHIKKVGVFVDENIDKVLEIANNYSLNYVQLHGNETPDDCKNIKSNHIGVIKAFSVGDQFDFRQLKPYTENVDYFLFDTASASHGGTGKKFNWELLKAYPHNTPYFLAGGIAPEDASTMNKLTLNHLNTLDLNSKFEWEPGLKNSEAIKLFIAQLHNQENTITNEI